MNGPVPGAPVQPIPQNRPMQPNHMPTARPSMPPGTVPISKPAVKPPSADIPLELEAETPSAGPATVSKIHAITAAGGHGQHSWKRLPHTNPTGAIRVKSFHGRLSDNGLEYLDNAINDWLDAHPEIDIKFVTSTEGMFDGKIKEPALILNVWF